MLHLGEIVLQVLKCHQRPTGSQPFYNIEVINLNEAREMWLVRSFTDFRKIRLHIQKSKHIYKDIKSARQMIPWKPFSVQGFSHLWQPSSGSATNKYTRHVSRLRHDCHACGSKTSMSHQLMPVFQFLTPGRTSWAKAAGALFGIQTLDELCFKRNQNSTCTRNILLF